VHDFVRPPAGFDKEGKKDMKRSLHAARLLSRAALALTALTCLSGTAARADTGANDWVAQQIAVGTDGASRVLWTNISPGTGGQLVGVWKFDASDTETAIGPVYGPYSDSNGTWVAKKLAVAPDGTLRLLWTSDGANGQEVVVWTMDANGNLTTVGTVYGPFTDSSGRWFVRDLKVAPDGTSRLLFTEYGTSGARAVVWKMDASGKQTSGGTAYGPYSTSAGSWFPQQLAMASDGTTRLLWTIYGTTTSGTYSGDTFGIWTLDAP
jgi:hypothetical protein